jgi:hypothetical protein
MKANMQETATTETPTTSRTEGPRDRKTKHSETPNRAIRFPRKQQQHLVAGRRKRHQKMGLLLIRWEAVKRRQGQGANLRPMGK